MADFKPSQIKPFFPHSPFGNTEKEIMAGYIVSYLAANGDSWDKKIGVKEFADFTQTLPDGMPEMFQNPLQNQILAEGCVRAVREFDRDGFVKLERGENGDTLTVQPKMIDEFYSQYVVSRDNFKRGDIAKQ